MKRLIVLIAVLIPILANSQNTVYLTFQPTDLGAGLRYDHQVNTDFGLYASASYGQYRMPMGSYIKEHLKFAFGAMKYMPPNKDNGAIVHFGAGFVHDRYGEVKITFDGFNTEVLRPITFECFTGIRLQKGFSLGLRFNFFKVESSIDIGYAF